MKIAVFSADSRWNPLGDDWQTLEMNLREATYQKAMQEGIPASTLIPLSGVLAKLKVVVYDYGADKVGSAMKYIN